MVGYGGEVVVAGDGGASRGRERQSLGYEKRKREFWYEKEREPMVMRKEEKEVLIWRHGHVEYIIVACKPSKPDWLLLANPTNLIG